MGNCVAPIIAHPGDAPTLPAFHPTRMRVWLGRLERAVSNSSRGDKALESARRGGRLEIKRGVGGRGDAVRTFFARVVAMTTWIEARLVRIPLVAVFAWGSLDAVRLERLGAQSLDDYSASAIQSAMEELAAAEKRLAEGAIDKAEGEAKVESARQRLRAEQAWAARRKVAAAESHVASTQQAITALANRIKAGQAKVAETAAAAEKAETERKAADEQLKAVPPDQEPKITEAQKVLAQREEAATKAATAAESAKKAVDEAQREKDTADKELADRKAALTEARDAYAVAHATAMGGLVPISSRDWDYAKARHLLFRAGFGGTPEEIQKLVDMGPHEAVRFLVDYRNRPMANIEVESDVYSWELPLDYEQRLHVEARNEIAEVDGKRNVDKHAVLVRWWVRRLLESPRPMEERLVLFWHDHFATSFRTLNDTYLMYQQNEFFRKYADNFEALLHGIVQDPAMIRYLNNDENEAGHVNENFGRELLELFSLGEEHSAAHTESGYTEKDVRDANTRALTGASYEHYSAQFRFYHGRHDDEAKTLLGSTGAIGAHEAVDIMLRHPGTSRYLAKKLWQYFAYWEPEPEVVDRVAHMLRANGYRIRPVLENVFLSQAFYSDHAIANHIKSPVELLVGTARAAGFAKVDYQNVRFLLASMGQSLFDPPSVAGWEEGRDWINTNLLMARYTATVDLVKKGGGDYVALLKDRSFADTEAVVDHMIERFLARPLPPGKRRTLIEFVGPLPPSAEWAAQAKAINAKLQALVILLVSSPEYQVS